MNHVTRAMNHVTRAVRSGVVCDACCSNAGLSSSSAGRSFLTMVRLPVALATSRYPRMRVDVRIDRDEQFARGRRRRAVARFMGIQPRPAAIEPDFRERPCDPGRLAAGQAVDEDDFEVAERLPAERLEATPHRLMRLVRGNHHGHAWNRRRAGFGRGHPEPPYGRSRGRSAATSGRWW